MTIILSNAGIFVLILSRKISTKGWSCLSEVNQYKYNTHALLLPYDSKTLQEHAASEGHRLEI